jgi:hypothetical protein
VWDESKDKEEGKRGKAHVKRSAQGSGTTNKAQVKRTRLKAQVRRLAQGSGKTNKAQGLSGTISSSETISSRLG